MKKQKENSHEGITWSEMGKQNVQAKEVYYSCHLKAEWLHGLWVCVFWGNEFQSILLLHSFLTSQLLYFPKIIVIVDVLGRIPSCCWLGFRMLIDWKESDKKQVLFSNTYRLPRLKKIGSNAFSFIGSHKWSYTIYFIESTSCPKNKGLYSKRKSPFITYQSPVLLAICWGFKLPYKIIRETSNLIIHFVEHAVDSKLLAGQC